MHARTNACGSSIRRQSWCKYPQGLLLGVLCGWSLKSFPQRTRSFTEVATEVLGPDGLAGPWARDRVYSRALTIAGGTTQVNKNILAQRMLGLPRQ